MSDVTELKKEELEKVSGGDGNVTTVYVYGVYRSLTDPNLYAKVLEFSGWDTGTVTYYKGTLSNGTFYYNEPKKYCHSYRLFRSDFDTSASCK